MAILFMYQLLLSITPQSPSAWRPNKRLGSTPASLSTAKAFLETILRPNGKRAGSYLSIGPSFRVVSPEAELLGGEGGIDQALVLRGEPGESVTGRRGRLQ